MKSYLHVLVVLAIDANFHFAECDMAKLKQSIIWDINNKNELQTHQGMDSRHMQKVNSSDKNGIILSINIVFDDRLTCNVNKVYIYMLLVMGIYIQSSQRNT